MLNSSNEPLAPRSHRQQRQPLMCLTSWPLGREPSVENGLILYQWDQSRSKRRRVSVNWNFLLGWLISIWNKTFAKRNYATPLSIFIWVAFWFCSMNTDLSSPLLSIPTVCSVHVQMCADAVKLSVVTELYCGIMNVLSWLLSYFDLIQSICYWQNQPASVFVAMSTTIIIGRDWSY